MTIGARKASFPVEVLMRIGGIARTAVALAGLGYGIAAATTYRRYGRPAPRGLDPLLDRFVPRPEAWDQHQITVAAPVERAFATFRTSEFRSPVIHALFALRERLLGGTPSPPAPPRPFLDELRALGWVLLAETPGRELVFGAVTRPWEARPEFRPVPPARFAAFEEPGYVKIIWNLAADPLGPGASLVRTETRVVTTDAEARERFRQYWAAVLPGVKLIRRVMLRQVRREAEGGRRPRVWREIREALQLPAG